METVVESYSRGRSAQSHSQCPQWSAVKLSTPQLAWLILGGKRTLRRFPCARGPGRKWFAEEVGMIGSVRNGLRVLPVLALLGVAAGCHSFLTEGPRPAKFDAPEKEPPLAGVPTQHSFRVAQFLFQYDFDLMRDLPLFHELAGLGEQVSRELQLPVAHTLVQVYLFENRDRYEHFMRARYPDLPKRRAFFVAQPRGVGAGEDLLVYTYWGERIQEDLRHELTHALLHSVLKDVPLWLDEGLAEYFEVPPDGKGINRHHLDQIRRASGGAFHPDLARLEQLSQVQQMTPAEYRESWAWVHLMLRDKSEAKAVLVAFLQQLRTNPNPGLLGPRLVAVYPNPNDTLDKHLVQLDTTPSLPHAQNSPRIQ
jgi:hypothetical protein